jgi:pyruvate dehydrogenase E2 component (dihydrolipoyllysine-residue acetyltransferase)
MAQLLRMPAVSTSSTTATLVQWCLPEGGEFTKDDVLALAETDKAEVEIPAEAAGVLLRTLIPEHTEVPFGDPVAVLVEPGEQVDDPDTLLMELGLRDAPDATRPTAPAKRPAAAEPAARVFASPLARKMAKEADLAVADLTGTGPGGRIIRRDVTAAIAARRDIAATETTRVHPLEPPPVQAELDAPARTDTESEDIPHTRIRRVIATRLAESFRTAPHFYLRAECRVDALLDLLEGVRGATTTPAKITVTDLIVKAVGIAHSVVPDLNVVWTDESVRRYRVADIALAIATDDGLVTGVLHDVGAKSVSAIAADRKSLVDRARSGRLRPAEVDGGTITVSNLGMTGVQEFSAVINPPHASILAVGAIVERPIVAAGNIEVARTMSMVLSVDHRPVDGMAAARWLAELVAVIENPLRILS